MWPSVKLSKLCTKITDGSHNPPKGIDYSEHIMLSSKNVFDDHIHLENPRYLNKADFEAENKRTDVCIGDVLLTIVGTIGRVGVVDESLPKFTLQRSVAVLKPQFEAIAPRFLMYSLRNILEQLLGKSRGVAQKGLYLKTLRDIEIALPPIPEQQRLVAILDQAFSDIEKARANAEQNLKNARELFDSYLNTLLLEVCSEKPSQTLNCISELIVDCEHKTAPVQDEGYPSIRTPNIGRGHLILDNVRRVSEETYHLWTRRALPMPGDLILAREAPAGNVGVIPDGEKVCLGQRTVLIRPNKNEVNSQYLAFFLLHPIMQNRLLAHSTGATVQHVNMKDIRQLPVARFPSLVGQLTNVEKILDTKIKMQSLELIYINKLASLDELKKSLLQKAFSGELIKSNGIAA